METRICVICGEEFWPIEGPGISNCCSETCQNEYQDMMSDAEKFGL